MILLPRWAVLASVVLASLACQCGVERDAPPAEPSPRAPPAAAPVAGPPADGDVVPREGVVGAPAACDATDGSGVPFWTEGRRAQLPLAVAQDELEGQNELCGDARCEDSFEWYFYDLRSDDQGSEQTMRMYQPADPEGMEGPAGDARAIEVRGPGYVGRVLRQEQVPRCEPPCASLLPFEPCLVLDVRCELARPYGEAKPEWDVWERELRTCLDRIEDAVREEIPPFWN